MVPKVRMSAQPKKLPGKPRSSPRATVVLSLYVAGDTPKSRTALSNLKKICAEHLDGRYRIKVIDLLENPKLARDHQILALPTLVRQLPQPIRKIIGDLSNTERVLVGLGIESTK